MRMRTQRTDSLSYKKKRRRRGDSPLWFSEAEKVVKSVHEGKCLNNFGDGYMEEET